MNHIKDKNWFLAFFILTLAFTFSACSQKASKTNYAYKMKLAHDAWVKSESKEPEFVKAGEEVRVGREVVIVETPGHVDAVLMPPTSQNKHLNLSLRPIPYWSDKNLAKYANSVISDVFSRTNQAQLLLGKGNSREALKEVRQLQKDYPAITYLKFLEASCLTVMGEKQYAAEVLRTALADFPENEEARVLYQALTGEDYVD
jgi:tetratricopeptide (TPR) repeat protein